MSLNVSSRRLLSFYGWPVSRLCWLHFDDNQAVMDEGLCIIKLFRWTIYFYIKLSIGSSEGSTESTLLHQKFAHVLWYCRPPYISLPSPCLDDPVVVLFTFNRQIPHATLPSSEADTWCSVKSRLLRGGWLVTEQSNVKINISSSFWTNRKSSSVSWVGVTNLHPQVRHFVKINGFFLAKKLIKLHQETYLVLRCFCDWQRVNWTTMPCIENAKTEFRSTYHNFWTGKKAWNALPCPLYLLLDIFEFLVVWCLKTNKKKLVRMKH